ncbi:MAG: hypothetical protein EOP06_19190, partial [Proteobacteria bacterium]
MKAGNKVLAISLIALLSIQSCAEAPTPSKRSPTGNNNDGDGTNGGGTNGGGTGGGTSNGGGTGGGSGGGTGTGGSTVLAGNIKVPADRGYQNIPWEEFQAEDGVLGGAAAKIGPSRKKWDINHIEAEAIGRVAVRLDKTGDSITFKPTRAGNSIVVRLSIPDSPNGGGIESTIGIYVNGKRTSLPVTSKYSWSYQGGLIGDPKMDDPRVSSVSPHTFFDEARILLPEFAAGAEIKIQR